MDETRNYFIEGIDQNEMMSMNHKNFCTVLNIEHYLILVSEVTGCISISAFASLLGISIGITSFAIALKIFAITAGIKACSNISQ